jgi:hypothetical protein
MTNDSNGTRLPARTRIYQNWVLDSTRWNYVSHRADDIVITTLVQSRHNVDAGDNR